MLAKKMLMIAIVGYCIFTAFTAFSQSVIMLIALRFLTGMFLGTGMEHRHGPRCGDMAGFCAGQGAWFDAIRIRLRFFSGRRSLVAHPTLRGA